jgi:hypothetical protein
MYVYKGEIILYAWFNIFLHTLCTWSPFKLPLTFLFNHCTFCYIINCCNTTSLFLYRLPLDPTLWELFFCDNDPAGWEQTGLAQTTTSPLPSSPSPSSSQPPPTLRVGLQDLVAVGHASWGPPRGSQVIRLLFARYYTTWWRLLLWLSGRFRGRGGFLIATTAEKSPPQHGQWHYGGYFGRRRKSLDNTRWFLYLLS